MTHRHTADTITDEALDHLYTDRDQARQRAADAYGQRDRLRHRIAALAERWQLPGHISMPDAAAEIADALDREKWAPVPDQLARVRALRDDLRGITGARYIADMLDKILDPPGAAASPQCGNACSEGHTYGFRCEQQPAPAATEATEPHTGLVVQPYRNDAGRPAWVFRCWGTGTCDGYLSLDHTSQQSAERARDRHAAEDHPAKPVPCPACARAGQAGLADNEQHPECRTQEQP